jgi:hypothetical protein
VPIVDEYFAWIKSIQSKCTGVLADAVDYSINQEQYLRAFLLDGNLELLNNIAERTIKPFVIR